MIHEAYFSAVFEIYSLKKPKSFNSMDHELRHFLSNISWPLSILLKFHLVMSFPLIYFFGPQKSLNFISKSPILRSFHEILKNIIVMVHHDN